MTEKDIIAQFLSRDEKAVENTKKYYGGIVRRCIAKVLAEKNDIEECENDTYLRVWNLIPPDRPENFAAYIRKVARYMALSLLKKKDKGNNISIEESYEELGESLISKTAGPEEQLEAAELARAISEFLAGKSKEKRVMFVKRYWYYESVKDIASEMEISETKVTTVLARLRNELKEELIRQGYIER
ncbi:MAG: sigma-70 family RNA polymerase sigma factor [Lachnospiraceae bacterium]|nr:sigma-70 family RNA polymerase sigma factor [Lachnospiraceae bacterium]